MKVSLLANEQVRCMTAISAKLSSAQLVSMAAFGFDHLKAVGLLPTTFQPLGHLSWTTKAVVGSGKMRTDWMEGFAKRKRLNERLES